MEDRASDVGEGRSVVTAAVWEQPRTTAIPKDADELTTLEAYLEYYRETVELKCAGVAPERLSERSSPLSSMSLHGLLRHLAGMERWWFAINFGGLDLPMLYYSDDDPDQDFETLDADPLVALEVWRAECDRSRRIVEGAAGLDVIGVVERGGRYTLRWLMLRMISEYAQHAGHADLLREGIDGAVGA
ncbi:MAG: DinB family protein [Acidimicrobiales bacterium]